MESASFRPTLPAARPISEATPDARSLAPDRRTRVLVVDDSYFMQRRLTEILQSAPDLRVVGCADSGAEAIGLAERLSPDVITMDVNMGKFEGLHAIDYIMRSTPRPIVIVSSYTAKGSRAALYGLEMGVIDIVEKPSSSGLAPDGSRAEEIIAKVRAASRIRVVRTLRGTAQELPLAVSAARAEEPQGSEMTGRLPVLEFPDGLPQVVGIGASTGGPVVLQELLRVVPHEFFPPVIIVQHLPQKFSREFAAQLNAISSLEIIEAQNGVQLHWGSCYVAPGGLHLQVDSQGRLLVNDGPAVNHCKPSVDVLFHSLARHYGRRTLSIVLTGIGDDGAAGALAIRRAGGCVIAQNEASSVVFSMPAAAIRVGAVHEVLSLESLKRFIIRLGERAADMAVESPSLPASLPNVTRL